MKKLVPMFIIFLSAVLFAQTKIDDELIKRTEEWFKNNPNSMPHWLTPDEIRSGDKTSKSFIQTVPPVGPVRQTAEFERMQGVLVRYAFGIPVAFIKQMSLVTDVVTIVASTSEKNTVISSYISAGIDTSKCDFLIAPSDSYWTRDYGPWYVVNGNNEVGICDFPYNRPARPNDDNIPVVAAPYLDEPLYGMNVVHTGGNYMTDGMGVGASTTLVYEESYSTLGISEAQVDQRMNDYLGIHTYHVVEDPNNTYIGHIDCWGKFLDVDKLLIRSVPTSHAQYDEIEAVVDYFEAQTSSYGTPYQIYRVNTPNNEPYTNSLILNDRVFVPIMSTSYDAAALAVYQAAMPGYTVVGVTNTVAPWESTDALHCRTRGIIDKEMLNLYHVATLTDQSSAESYPISAKIVSYGGHTITSATLYYKINSGSWNTITMSGNGGNYTATIPQQAAGSSVSYYIHATDNSGRVENHPFIGSADPHRFSIYNGGTVGGTFAVNQTSLSYGNVETGSSSVKTFTITNSHGTDYLEGSINTISGYTAAASVKEEQKNVINYSISPNSSKTFDLTFSPVAEQTYNGNIAITSSDTGHPTTNIAVTGTGTVPVFGLPFTQNFNASTSLPAAWTIVDNQGNGQVWQFGTHSSGLGGTPGNYAYVNSDGYGSSGSQNCNLVTPKINMTGGTNVTLTFKHYFRSYSGSSATLSYSTNGGSTWTQIQQWTATSANPATFSQVINALDGQANVKLKWNYTGSYGYYWDIDDISITASMSAPGAPANVITSLSGTDLIISWDASAGATNYDVYSSSTPYGTFSYEANVTTSSYTTAYTNSMKFYYIVSKNSTK